ncbi:exonuclease domain-containing protein [Rarobacter incanus]|uniref:DNA polymerase-3 subunit epsilon n=1 Tax=Rarobacter incanus TaxID=153494 RepID=A0A542SR88_9MICO|nr:exonuclease domain-containing protein [Rarobacter incanus]TQK77115.1 DNA polymerase-3 subunit epsilon [Rarobacter incanus]
MNAWIEAPVAAFDTETTGVDVVADRIVTASIVTAVPGTVPISTQEWLIDPGVPIPAGAAAIHGVTTEYAQANGMDAAQGIDAVAGTLAGGIAAGVPIVVFNAAYDLPLLAAEIDRYNLPSIQERTGGISPLVIDPLVLDRAVDRYRRGKRTLETLCEVYDVDVPDALHNSTTDSAMTLLVLAAMFKRHRAALDMPLQQLQDFQRTAHAAWAKNFNQWRERQGYSGQGPSEEWLP